MNRATQTQTETRAVALPVPTEGAVTVAQTSRRLDPSRIGGQAEELRAILREKVVGQDEAVDQIVSMYQLYLTGLASPGRPIANLLFLGPTGSGKTRLVEAVAESLVGSAKAVVKIDCGEYQHSHEIAKLVGSPPGYLGHRETHPALSQQALDQHHTEKVKISFVLFDELEKASDSLWNLMLGILDKASLTLGDNQKVDFSHSMVFMTSNLGATEMEALLQPRLGFAPPDGSSNPRKAGDRISVTGVGAARRKFTPEFINRIDKILVFRPLGPAELHAILDLELRAVQERILRSSDTAFAFSVTPHAEAFLLEEGTDARYGARHLKRAVERALVHPLSNLMATGQVYSGDSIRVDFDEAARQLTFSKDDVGMVASGLARV